MYALGRINPGRGCPGAIFLEDNHDVQESLGVGNDNPQTGNT